MATYVISYIKNSSYKYFTTEDFDEAQLHISCLEDETDVEDLEYFTIDDEDEDFDYADFVANLDCGAYGTPE